MLVGCRETFKELFPPADKLQFHETFIESTAHLHLCFYHLASYDIVILVHSIGNIYKDCKDCFIQTSDLYFGTDGWK